MAALLVLVAVAYRGGFGNDDTKLSSDDKNPGSSPSEVVDGGSGTNAEPSSIVLAISIDGLNPAALTLLGEIRSPNFHRLIREGASTLNARTAYELTITLPNHTGMLTGRAVSGENGHSVTMNLDNGRTLADDHGTYIPGVFDVVHDNGLRTALFAEKEKFAYLIRSWDAEHGAPDVTGPDDGRDKIDLDFIGRPDDLIQGVQDALTSRKASLIFLHLAAPDSAGHDSGWFSDDYLSAVESVDRELGLLLATIDQDAGLKAGLTILLTADHGGPEGLRAHDEPSELSNYRIPFIAWGQAAQSKSDLYDLNPRRLDPANGRPDYAAIQPIRNVDIADVALALLDLPSIQGAVSTTWPRLQLAQP